MRRGINLLWIVAALAACNSEVPPASDAPECADQAPGTQQPSDSPTVTGTVVQTMNSGGYTYVNLDRGGWRIWAVGPETALSVGNDVTLQQTIMMENFHSKSLSRDFEAILFADRIETGHEIDSKQQVGSQWVKHLRTAKPRRGDLQLSGIERAEGGLTVEEVYTSRQSLSGTDVSVRGKVVKVRAKILDRNWVHIQDGTGNEDTDDLVVETKDVSEVGDTVLVNGVVAVDKDIGAGVRYDVLLENATVSVE